MPKKSLGRILRIKATILSNLVLVLVTAALASAGTGVDAGEHVPNQIIVKFCGETANTLETISTEDTSWSRIQWSHSLKKLNKTHRMHKVTPLFRNFSKSRQRLKALSKQDRANLTDKEKHILKRLMRAPKGSKIPELDRIYVLEVDLDPNQSLEDVVEAYNNDPDVEYAELNYRVSIDAEPNDPLYPVQWPLNNTGQMYPESGAYNHPPGTADADIDAPEAWGITTGSDNVIVAVIDTGVDYTHRDIDNNMWVNEAEFNGTAGIDDDGNGYVDDVYGYDFFLFWLGRGDSDPIDDEGHGTHCAGIIAAEINNGLDIAGICGGAKIMALKFIGSVGIGYTSDAIESLYYAVDNGADIISCSWGGSEYSQALADVIDYAHSQGVIVVAAAGNNGNTNPHYPAYYDHVISVAATNSRDEKASFSTYGDWVDIAAPGVDILSLRAAGTYRGTVYDKFTTIDSGTSMSCPYVAGVCALMLSICPEMELDYLEDSLLASADTIEPQFCASGRVNAHKAIRQMANRQGAVFLDRELYNCSSLIGIKLLDPDLTGNSTQSVTIETDGGDFETILLNETGSSLGIFAGTISADSGDPNIEDGILQLSDGQTITVTYTDSDDGMGNPAIATDTATTECQAATIFNVDINGPGQVLTFTFETDEPTTARVLGGLSCTGPYTFEALESIRTTSHTVKLTGVSPETNYYFAIEATDAAGNITIEDNNGQCYLFTTTGPRDMYVPSEFSTIQGAIDVSWDGSVIWVADGAYTSDGNRKINFKGKAITVKSENGPENCIIDCNSEGLRGFDFRSGEDANSILTGFTITNCDGGILCLNSNPTIINCKIISIYPSSNGIYCDHSSPLIIHCTISNIEGRGMCNYDSSPTLIECTFIDNSIFHYLFCGGGMFNVKSSPKITNCNFINNSAVEGGGIYCKDGSSPILTGCTFIENEASRVGGGLFSSWGSEPVITNCTFIGNTAEEGAGFYCRGNTVISNCTFVENTGWNLGGAVSLTGDAVMSNCILYYDTAPRGAEVALRSSTIDIDHSNIQGGSEEIYVDSLSTLNWGEGNIDEDPLFAFNTDYHLMPDSPCIDAGTNEPNVALQETDIDGGQRSLDGDTDGTAVVDMGAHEYNPQGPSIAVSAYAVEYLYVPGWSESSSKTQTLLIKNCGNGVLNWEIAEDCNWLEVVPTNGTSAGETDEVTLTIDTDALPQDDSICTALTIQDPNAANSPLKVWVSLRIGTIRRIPQEYPTILDAIINCRDGDVVIVSPGTYQENVWFEKNITLTSANPAEIESVDETIIDGNINFYGTETPNCILDSFKINGLIFGRGTHTTISRCIFRRNEPSAALISDCMGIISNCLIADNRLPKGGPPGPLISGCHGVFRNCTIANHSIYSRMRILEGGITTIENCIFYSDKIELFGGAELNISYSNLKGGLESIVLADPCTCTVNWGPGNTDSDPCFAAVGYWVWDPNVGYVFVDGDYHLMPDSPCINTGDPNYAYDPNETDLDGNPRIIGGRIDMGAYEYNPNITPVADAGPDGEVYAWIDGIAEVTLDGSGSYDDDGDELTYLWSWQIGSVIYEANGVNPTIELPVGEHTIELIVNDGTEDSEPNYTKITVIEPLEAELRIMPRVINRKSGGRFIIAWLQLPPTITEDDIDDEFTLIMYPGGIEVTRKRSFTNLRKHLPCTNIIALFYRRDLIEAVGDETRVSIEVVGKLTTGQYFFAQRRVLIINRLR